MSRLKAVTVQQVEKSGGKWVVKDGAIEGSQDVPGNGGIILSNKEYGNFEVRLEMKNDFGPDSGLFLRSTEDGRCYQAMIDYHANGNLMGIYGEGLGGNPHLRNFSFLETVDKIKVDSAPVPLPVKPEEWKAFWNPDEWNEIGRSDRRKSSDSHHVHSRKEIYGIHRYRKASGRCRSYRIAGTRRRRFHKTVCSIPKRSRQDA